MKKAYVIILITNFILAGNIINVNAANKLDFQFDNPNQIIGDISIGKIEYSTIINSDTEYIRLNIQNAYNSRIVGEPELPQINNLIEIPRGATPYIEIIHDEQIEFDLNTLPNATKIYPAQPSISKSEITENQKFIINESR